MSNRQVSAVAIIPARFGSTRLPGKPLADLLGKPMIRRVYERVRLARRVDRVLVATDDERIATAVRDFGGEAVLTSPAHTCGTERVAEVARGCMADVFVNVQGDEPLLDPSGIDAAVQVLADDPEAELATLSAPLTIVEEMLSPTVVKIVTDVRGNALYFSRSPIPHVRLGPSLDLGAAAREAVARGLARKHIGLYAYRREILLRLASLPPAPLEEAESLEQLRALHHGMRIRVVPVAAWEGQAVDTPADLDRVRALLARSAD